VHRAPYGSDQEAPSRSVDVAEKQITFDEETQTWLEALGYLRAFDIS